MADKRTHRPAAPPVPPGAPPPRPAHRRLGDWLGQDSGVAGLTRGALACLLAAATTLAGLATYEQWGREPGSREDLREAREHARAAGHDAHAAGEAGGRAAKKGLFH